MRRQHAERAFTALLGDARLGSVWLGEQGGNAVGYAVVALVFGMEYGGLQAVVDDFYVRSAFRNRGLGSALLVAVRDACAGRGVRALSVEVGRENAAAQAVYRRAGFEPAADRRVMKLALATPVHEE